MYILMCTLYKNIYKNINVYINKFPGWGKQSCYPDISYEFSQKRRTF